MVVKPLAIDLATKEAYAGRPFDLIIHLTCERRIATC